MRSINSLYDKIHIECIQTFQLLFNITNVQYEIQKVLNIIGRCSPSDLCFSTPKKNTNDLQLVFFYIRRDEDLLHLNLVTKITILLWIS